MASWDDRILCPDDNCIGVIGPDGACKVCGRVAPSTARAGSDPSGKASEGDDDEYDDDEDGEYEDDEDGEYEDDEDGEYEDDEDADAVADADVEPGLAATAAKPKARSGDDWDNRELCPDGACTGVMAPGGKCSVCGRTAAEINA
jgi:hypothetical protein